MSIIQDNLNRELRVKTQMFYDALLSYCKWIETERAHGGMEDILPSVERASAIRASMELTRALSQFRKPRR